MTSIFFITPSCEVGLETEVPSETGMLKCSFFSLWVMLDTQTGLHVQTQEVFCNRNFAHHPEHSPELAARSFTHSEM